MRVPLKVVRQEKHLDMRHWFMEPSFGWVINLCFDPPTSAKLYSPTGSALLDRYLLVHTSNRLLFFVSPNVKAKVKQKMKNNKEYELSDQHLENEVWGLVQQMSFAQLKADKQSQLDCIVKAADDKVAKMHVLISTIAHKLTDRERYELEQGFLVCKSYINQIARDSNCDF